MLFSSNNDVLWSGMTMVGIRQNLPELRSL